MNKKLYKSRTDRAICGVCGGLAEYFEIDVIVIRLLFVIFAFAGGAALVGYIAAAIIIPQEPIGGMRTEMEAANGLNTGSRMNNMGGMNAGNTMNQTNHMNEMNVANAEVGRSTKNEEMKADIIHDTEACGDVSSEQSVKVFREVNETTSTEGAQGKGSCATDGANCTYAASNGTVYENKMGVAEGPQKSRSNSNNGKFFWISIYCSW